MWRPDAKKPGFYEKSSLSKPEMPAKPGFWDFPACPDDAGCGVGRHILQANEYLSAEKATNQPQ
jgi:hypothetical protein